MNTTQLVRAFIDTTIRLTTIFNKEMLRQTKLFFFKQNSSLAIDNLQYTFYNIQPPAKEKI